MLFNTGLTHLGSESSICLKNTLVIKPIQFILQKNLNTKLITTEIYTSILDFIAQILWILLEFMANVTDIWKPPSLSELTPY